METNNGKQVDINNQPPKRNNPVYVSPSMPIGNSVVQDKQVYENTFWF